VTATLDTELNDVTLSQPLTAQGAGTASVIKAGSGKLILGGNNTYSGSTTAQRGTLVVNGSLAAASAVTIQSGAQLAGHGTVSGSVLVEAGGTVAPGESPGILQSGSITLESTATLTIAIEGAEAGTGYSQLEVTGTVDLQSPTLVLTGLYLPAVGASLVIIKNDGVADAVTGTFDGLAEGATIAFRGEALMVSYSGGDGNDVVLRRDPPVAATLAYFHATSVSPGGVRLDWSTLVEVQTLGFYLDRAVATGPWQRLAGGLIPAQGSDQAPHTYSLTDPRDASPRGTRYRLIEVDWRGQETVIGSASVTAGLRLALERAAGGLNMQIEGMANGTVLVESASTPAGPWIVLGEVPLDADGLTTLSLNLDDAAAEATQFYRLRAE
jgi:autotransporter-associated beta strand protein